MVSGGTAFAQKPCLPAPKETEVLALLSPPPEGLPRALPNLGGQPEASFWELPPWDGSFPFWKLSNSHS